MNGTIKTIVAIGISILQGSDEWIVGRQKYC